MTPHARLRGLPSALVLAALLAVGGTVALTACSTGDRARPAGFVAASTPAPTASATPTPVITEVVETEVIAFAQTTTEDVTLPRGQVVVTPGVEGVRTITYRVTTVEGRETDRTVVSDVVTTAPVAEVTTTGTYDPPAPVAVAAPACDSHYTDNCVPIDSDVDCAGGSGNGPSYLEGTARVVGTDVYDLDRDDNGVACD